MKLYSIVLLILLLMIAIPDIFFYRKLKDRNAKPIYIILHLIPAFFFAGLFFYVKFKLEYSQNFRIVVWIMWLYFVFILIYIPKLIHIIFYFISVLYEKIAKHHIVHFKSARIVVTIIVITTMLISAYITPRNFEVTKVQLFIPNLPQSFNGYRIVQLSDIHLGSWNKKFSKLYPVIKLVNQQHADMLVFTGDMVNNFAGEAEGWQPYFAKLKAKDGKYAILGNHDYGDYTEWKLEKERIENKEKIRQYIRDFGFKLLLNEHVFIRSKNDSLLLIGVENWGKTKDSRYCDLNKALEGITAMQASNQMTKILLSHDPNHWENEVVGKKNIDVTLSGHTHAGQLGIKIGNKLFSPASLVFKYWVGLYEVNRQLLYVNRGIGYIGLPMHIGVRPEITVFELRRK
jgi:uncharacterized protein